MQTETQLEKPRINIQREKPGIQCPKCGTTRTTRTESTKKYRAYECSSCGYAWQEPKVTQPPSKSKCVAWMTITVFAYLIGIELIQSLGSTWIETLAVLAVFSVPHELLHALTRRFFGYRAIPIPLLFPPILGITVGPKPQKTSERAAAASAPLLLTAATFLLYCFTSNDRYAMLGIFNLFFTAFDILPMILPRRSRRAPT